MKKSGRVLVLLLSTLALSCAIVGVGSGVFAYKAYGNNAADCSPAIGGYCTGSCNNCSDRDPGPALDCRCN